MSTFGDIARALGDVKAARAVGAVLAEAEEETSVPGHRVVFFNGRVAGDAHQGLLREEGIEVARGAVIDLEGSRFVDFDLPPVLAQLRREQERMRALVVEADPPVPPLFAAGFDVSYAGDRACVALVRMDLGTLEVIEERVAFGRTRFPYIPGYLGYRELPMARKVVERRGDTVLLVDGQGVLHPRGFGVACQVGVCLEVPTIGAAKSLLLGEVAQGGHYADIVLDGEVRGRMVKPKGRRATYVSVGHHIALRTACAVCERLMLRGAPEPLRLAHMLATRERKRMEMGL